MIEARWMMAFAILGQTVYSVPPLLALETKLIEDYYILPLVILVIACLPSFGLFFLCWPAQSDIR